MQSPEEMVLHERLSICSYPVCLLTTAADVYVKPLPPQPGLRPVSVSTSPEDEDPDDVQGPDQSLTRPAPKCQRCREENLCCTQSQGPFRCCQECSDAGLTCYIVRVPGVYRDTEAYDDLKPTRSVIPMDGDTTDSVSPDTFRRYGQDFRAPGGSPKPPQASRGDYPSPTETLSIRTRETDSGYRGDESDLEQTEIKQEEGESPDIGLHALPTST